MRLSSTAEKGQSASLDAGTVKRRSRTTSLVGSPFYNGNGFSLIELLVVIAIMALLMGILMPTLNLVREQGKRAACLGNLKQMGLAWNMYADDNDGRIVNGNNQDPMGWLTWPVQSLSKTRSLEEQRVDGIRNGLLYDYCRSLKVYKCPAGVRGEFVSYSIVASMNGYDATLDTKSKNRGRIVKNREQIRRPGQRAVFLDQGRLSPGSWTVWYDQERWADQVSARHGDGTNLSFADGHSEYWKWKDPRTLAICALDFDAWQKTGRDSDMSICPGSQDLHRIRLAVWGSYPKCKDGVCYGL